MNRLYIILGGVVLLMIVIVWKTNSERIAREQEYQQKTLQHMQKMAELETERRVKLAQEAIDKERKERQRIDENAKAKLESEKYMQYERQAEEDGYSENQHLMEQESLRYFYDSDY